MADNRLREMVNNAESNIAKLFKDDAAMKNFLDFIQKNTHLTYYAASMIQGTNYADTYDGWKERGFQVNAGEHGIPVFQKRKTIKRKFIDESGKIRDLATASYVEKQKIQNGDLKITSDLSSYYVINHLFSQEQTTAKDKILDIAVSVSNLSFDNIKSIVEESTNDILDGDDFVVPNSIMQCTVAYATYMLCLSENISGDKDELFEQSISSLSDSKERLTLSEQKLVLNSAIKVIRSEHTKELIESLNEELSGRYSESIEYGGFEYQVIDKWQNDVGTYIVGRLEADDGPWYAAKVIDKTEQFSGEYEYEFSNERPSQIEVEDMHLNHISEIDIDRHEAEYGADGSRTFSHLNDHAPAEEQEELKQIVAADITNIECTGRTYDKGNRENTYTFKCEIQGEMNNLTYIVSSHDDGESFSIHSENDDIWTSMDESELNKLENVLRNESFFYLWQQKIINATSESELDTISLDFLEVENVPTSIARRIYDCIGEKSKELGNSISAVSIDGHDCSIIDIWQNGTCSYTLGQDLNDNTFYYAKVEDSNENWKGTYTYEFDVKPVREEVEIVHLNKISALDIDNHEKVYGADGEIAVPGLNNEPEPKKKNKIEDFGKKIGGARKDLWKLRGLMVDDLLEMNLAEKNKYATKNNIFPKPDYQKMVDDGLPVRTAYFIKTVRDALPAKPVFELDDEELIEKKIQGYVEFISEFKETLLKLKTDEDILNFYDNAIKDVYVKNETSYRVVPTEKSHGCMTNKLLKACQISRYGLTQLDSKIKKKQFCYSEYDKKIDGFEIVKFDDSCEFDIDRGNTVLKRKHSHATYYFYPEGEFADSSKWIKDTYYVLYKRQIIAINLSEEQAKETVEKMAEKFDAVKGSKEAQKKARKKKFVPQQLQHIKRTGPSNGINEYNHADGQLYLDTFGFAGGEFGNWMNEKDRQASLDFGYDALMDLADALEIDPKDISLGGELSIAFGSRGVAGAFAHYEPLLQVINLTKMHGAGSLAHEWGHALDNILAKKFKGSGIDSWLTDRNRNTLDSVKELMDTMKLRPVTLADKQEKKEKLFDDSKSLLYDDFKCFFKENSYGEKFLKKNEEVITKLLQSGDGDTFKELIDTASSTYEKNTGCEIRESQKNVLIKEMEQCKLTYNQPIDEIVCYPKRTDFYTNSIKFDSIHSKESKGYWQSSKEMFARAFACYVQDKLSYRTDYLCGHANSAVTSVDDEVIKAFPEGAEREAINKCFDKVIGELKSKGLLHEQEQMKVRRKSR